ncbi:FAD binding domain-containing protein [Marinivivus vitaminiproducens]|uniref:FAD binding domain-containing protein n=1 Tax=Marinivivus vitaminiproducens TaxID=3035935 RepID=UPI002799912F|nr:xanthine dehydrogenase family protein subunit M [Geminicoccaceae bacterium SCSIO 64248]
MYAFSYERPTSVADAVSALKASEDAKLLAGGQTFIPTLKQRLAQPDALIDLNTIAELRFIREEGDNVVIGAMSRHGEIAGSEIVQRRIPGLVVLAGQIGDPAVRNRGTIGGSIANNDPSACYPAALLAYGATVHTDRRQIPAEDFFIDMFETALEPDEIVTAVSIPVPDASYYSKFANPASRYAIVGVMVAKTKDGVRVGVTGAKTCAYRATELEQALSGNFAPSALDGITVDAADMNADIHASAAYRAHLVKVMAKRSVERLV